MEAYNTPEIQVGQVLIKWSILASIFDSALFDFI